MSTLADSPFEVVATAIKSVFDQEFAAEGFVMVFDRLHESLGRNRVDVGIAPTEDAPMDGNAVVQQTFVEVRFYDLWRQEISPETVVNPTRITGFAERFRRSLKEAGALDPATEMVWFFDVQRVTYPPDPTGNITRFHAQIRAFGNNAALVETTA